MFGLFTRTFQFGTDHLAFHFVDGQGLPETIPCRRRLLVAWRNTVWHPFRALSGTVVTGWVVLAIGAYRSGALGLGRSIALGLMSVHLVGQPVKVDVRTGSARGASRCPP